jgi:hypothetical protein
MTQLDLPVLHRGPLGFGRLDAEQQKSEDRVEDDERKLESVNLSIKRTGNCS